MTVDEVTALMRWNVAMYANCAKPLSEENAATQITIWAAELVNVPAYAGQKAMRKAFTVCKFPVTLADLCDQLRSIQAEYAVPVADAWKKILQMISRVRYCGEPPLDYPAMFLDLPDVARDWLGSYHAALALNNMSDEGRMYKRSEFERFYEKWTKTAPLNPVLLPVNEEVEKQLAAERQKPLLPPKHGYDGWY